MIIDYATGKVVQSLKSRNRTVISGPLCYSKDSDPGNCDLDTFVPPRVYFAEQGRTLCEAAAVGAFKNYPVCRDVDTGETIAEFHGIDGGAPANVSTRASRMVLTKLNRLPSRLGDVSYSGRVVWDFRSGAEVAAWGTFAANVWSAPVFAISNSGKYVAEAIGDELHIYQLP